jgi:hypothetical protein
MSEIRRSENRKVRPPCFAGVRWVAAVAVLGICGPAFAAPGDISKKFSVNEENPSASIPSVEERNAAPLEFGYFLQDLYTRAELAFEKKDYANSVKYFEAIAKTIPDRALSFSKLCQGYQQLGKLDIAAANCGKAIQLEGATLVDHLRFIELSLSRGPLTPEDVANIDASVNHVSAHVAAVPEEPPPAPAPARPPGQKLTAEEAAASIARVKDARLHREQVQRRATFLMDFELLRCRLALRLRDVTRLNACLVELQKQKANERVILPFDWSKALIQKDRARASALLERAQLLGIPAATLQRMADEQEKAFRPAGVLGVISAWGTRGILVALAVVALAVGILGAWFAAKRRSLSPARI